MHLYMSSYDHVECLPLIFEQSSPYSVPYKYETKDRKDDKYRGKCSSYSGNIDIPTIHPGDTKIIVMTNTTQEQKLSHNNNALDDLVKSDDQFLDQLEIMHYLTFSDL